MHKLALAPSVDGYQAADGTGVIRVELDGGSGKYRKDVQNSAVRVDVTWHVDPDDYLYLRTFYNVHDNGTLPFLMDLVIHSASLTEHECRFIPDTFKLSQVRGNEHTVKATLEVVPAEPDPAYDEGFVVSYEAFGRDSSSAFALLATLVNVNFPAAIPG